MKRLPKGPLLALVLVVALAGFLIWGGLRRGHNWGDDFSQYIMQAISIVEGQPQRFIAANRFTMEQSSTALGPVAYPWGFPLLLAPFYASFGLDLLALKAVNVICFLLFLGLLWFSFRKYHSPAGRIACVSLFALNPSLLRANDDILSDIPFLLLSTASIVLIGFVIVERRRLISITCDHLLLGGVIASAFFVRSNGILLLMTLMISQAVAVMLRRSADRHEPARSPNAATGTRHQNGNGLREIRIGLLPYVSFTILALAWTATLPQGGSSYLDHLSGITLAHIVRHLHYYLDLPARFFEGIPHHRIVYGATIPLALVGARSRVRSDYHILAYVVLTLSLYIVWPSTQGLRFLFPVLPFYLSFVLGSLDGSAGSFAPTAPSKWRKALWIVPVAVALIYFGRVSATHALDNLSRNRESLSGPFVHTSQEMFLFIRTHTPTDSTIIFFKPRVLRLLTGRNAIMINRVDQLVRGDYLCYYRADPSVDQLARPHIDRFAATGRLRLVYQNDDFEIYRLDKSSF